MTVNLIRKAKDDVLRSDDYYRGKNFIFILEIERRKDFIINYWFYSSRYIIVKRRDFS